MIFNTWLVSNEYFNVFITKIPTPEIMFPFYGWQWDKKTKTLEFTRFSDHWTYSKRARFTLDRKYKKRMIEDLFNMEK